MSASSPLDLKSTRLDALMLPLRSRDLPTVLAAAQAQWGSVSQAFDGDPLVLDVRELPLDGPPLDWAPFLAGLRLLGLQPVALTGGQRLLEPDQQAARIQGLQLGEASEARAVAPPAPALAAPAAPRCLVIERSLRSGQQVYARDADLVVLGLVSHGAEVIADGSVHVYGALRGRAIAGAKGDGSARIYAQSLEAELLAIAGTFRTSEKPLPAEVAGKPAQVRLTVADAGERLVFEPLKY